MAFAKLSKIKNRSSNLNKVLESCYFPICIDGDWKSFDWSNKIPGATPELKAAISDCQPCNRIDGKSPADHPLAVLSSMHNMDKHRLLLVTVMKAQVTTTFGPSFSRLLK